MMSALLGICSTTAMAAGTTWNIKVGSTTRNAIVYAPSGMNKPAIIIQCHGMNQDAAYQQGQAKWEPVADTGKFIVVYPNGNNKSWDLNGNTDIDFVKAIIDTMVAKYGADRNRAYLSGFSMGGMFTYTAMNKLSDKIAAFAPCSGYPMGGMTPSSPVPVPILHTHGTSDDVVAYSGVEGTLSKWRTWNNCPTAKTTIKPYPANKSGSVTTRDYWGPCTKNGKTVEVVLHSNAGKGHWYSEDAASAMSSVEIWNFSKKYSLGGNSSVGPTSPRDLVEARIQEGSLVLSAERPLDWARVRDLSGRDVAGVAMAGSDRTELAIPLNGARGILLVDVSEGGRRRSLRITVP